MEKIYQANGFLDCIIHESNNFEKYAALLKVDTPLIIRGRISGDEERKSMRAEQIIPLKDAHSYYKKIVISFNSDRLPEKDLKSLHSLLETNKGPCEVWFKINGMKNCRNFRSRSIMINPDPELLTKIKSIVGPASLQIYGRIYDNKASKGSKRHNMAKKGMMRP